MRENVDNYKPKHHGVAKCELVARWPSTAELPNEAFDYTLTLKGINVKCVNLMFEPGSASQMQPEGKTKLPQNIFNNFT